MNQTLRNYDCVHSVRRVDERLWMLTLRYRSFYLPEAGFEFILN